MLRTRRHTFNLNAYLDQVITVENTVTLASPTRTEPCTATVRMQGGSGRPAQLTLTASDQPTQITGAVDAPLEVELAPGQALTASVSTQGEPAEIELIVEFTYDAPGGAGAGGTQPWPAANGAFTVNATHQGPHEVAAGTIETYTVQIATPGDYKVTGIRAPVGSGRTEVFAPSVPPVVGNGIVATDYPIEDGLTFTAAAAGTYSILLRATAAAYTYSAFGVSGPLK